MWFIKTKTKNGASIRYQLLKSSAIHFFNFLILKDWKLIGYLSEYWMNRDEFTIRLVSSDDAVTQSLTTEYAVNELNRVDDRINESIWFAIEHGWQLSKAIERTRNCVGWWKRLVTRLTINSIRSRRVGMTGTDDWWWLVEMKMIQTPIVDQYASVITTEASELWPAGCDISRRGFQTIQLFSQALPFISCLPFELRTKLVKVNALDVMVITVHFNPGSNQLINFIDSPGSIPNWFSITFESIFDRFRIKSTIRSAHLTKEFPLDFFFFLSFSLSLYLSFFYLYKGC